MGDTFRNTGFPQSRRDALKAIAGSGVVFGTAGCIVSGDETTELRVGRFCEERGGYIYVNHDGDEEVEITVTGPDGYEESKTLAGRSPDNISFGELADGEYDLEVDDEGYRLSRTTVVFHCEKELAVTRDCVDREGRITVDNHNDEPVDVRVTGPDGYDETRQVEAGGSVAYSRLADGFYFLEADHDTIAVRHATIFIDCTPVLRNLVVGHTCEGDDGLIVVSNPNDQSVGVRVTGPDGYDETRTVPARDDDGHDGLEDSSIEFGGLEDGRYVVEADHDEIGVDGMTVDVACPRPAAVIQTFVSCREGKGVLHVSHDGDDGVTVSVTGPDGYREERVVGGPEQHASFRGLEAGKYHVEIDDEDFRPSLTSFVVDCPPVLGVSHACVGDDGRITVRNDNEAPATVTVTGPDGYETARTIEAGRSVQFCGLADGRYVLESGADEPVPEPGSVRIRCGPTPVDLRKTHDCFGRCGRITVTNDNPETVSVTATGPEGYRETKSVPANGSVEFRRLANGPYELTTDRDGIDVHQPDLTVSCPHEISVQDSCRDGGGVITVLWDGQAAGEVRVTGPDGYEETATVGGEEQVISFGDLADGAYRLESLDERFTLERTSVDLDCRD